MLQHGKDIVPIDKRARPHTTWGKKSYFWPGLRVCSWYKYNALKKKKQYSNCIFLLVFDMCDFFTEFR